MSDERLATNSKNKTMSRISRLFQKKPKKKSMTPSVFSLTLSDSTLSKQPTYQSTTSITSSHLSIQNMLEVSDTKSHLEQLSINDNDSGSAHLKLTKTTSIQSQHSFNIQQLIQQQRNVLKELDAQKALYSSDVNTLTEQLNNIKEKIKQRTTDMDILQKNYQLHLKSVRSSDDDPQSIAQKLLYLRQQIQLLAAELLPYAEPYKTGENLSILWLNLGPFIDRLGKPLSAERTQMLTEKFMMDVLVQNLNIHIFPGLSCNSEFLELQQWFEHHDPSSFFPTRLRQELSMLVVQNNKEQGHGDIQATWKKSADRNWHHLYRGLQKAYPSFFTEEEKKTNTFSKKLRKLVEYTMNLGSAIKGQEICITAVDVREGVQPFDEQLMEDVDGQTSGIITFCICPPFVVKVSNRFEPLVKGRVLCFPNNNEEEKEELSSIPE
ncbi:uncharacterized protein BX663DRAFT_435699 [Cokeromyces recurvatus]|uniref:uncharacterized protein n=1 Tax=Cokeromyces recurvatus TaxID=90255 RepID=UPI00221F1815|nr:uncharacterized protein BX663DRAFT_435699 [Cokeromyces recurvatus]KAI7902525.1 hypothetical protein BX663DRAFT_435699 [Cokeromyces recurvatus]